jgi:hypothetical protein
MTHRPVDDLPAEATSTLLGVCEQLSLSPHVGLARWAASVSDALLVRLASVTRRTRRRHRPQTVRPARVARRGRTGRAAFGRAGRC